MSMMRNLGNPRPARRLATIAALGVALALAGCSGQPAPATTLDPDADVQLTWWTGQAGTPQQTAEDLAAEFEDLHPNVSITVTPGAPTTSDLLQKLTAAFAGDTYPDISYAYGAWMGQLASSGKMLDLTQVVADPEIDWEDFPVPARDTATVDGVVVAFPALVDVLSIVYNKEIFDEAGVDYPTDDWTWDDFRTAAAELTNPDQEIYGTGVPIAGDEDTVWRLWPQVWQNGGQIQSAPGQPAFDEKAGVDALQYWGDLAVDDQSVYLDQTGQKHVPMFADGRIAMLITGPWALYDFVQGGIDYGVASIPGTDGDHQSISGPDMWAAFDHGDKNREYWTGQFLSWFTSADVDGRWSLATSNLPLRSSEADSDTFAQLVADYPGMDVFLRDLDAVVTTRPTDPEYVTLSREVGEAIQEVLQGAADADTALRDAAEATRDVVGG